MKRPLIAIVCGTRPEIVKLAPVYHALQGASWAEVVWIHTGQHESMAEEMLECFEIAPAIRLQRSGKALEEFSLECRSQLDAQFAQRSFDMCLVQGDTESAFLGALTAFYRKVPVAHVEAGLRTYNLSRPFPEEGLRQMISRLASMHFAPTKRAAEALRAEGIGHLQIMLTGNTVVDAQHWVAERHAIKRNAKNAGSILVTVHRREHWGNEMDQIFRAIADIAREHPKFKIVFPVHLNPVVQDAARKILHGIPNVHLTSPFNYVQMQQALADALMILTDSGGLQEEAPTYGVPVLVLRHETERPEAVEAGCAEVTGPDRLAIVNSVRRLLGDELAMKKMRVSKNPYGDGQASKHIVQMLAARLAPVAPSDVVVSPRPIRTKARGLRASSARLSADHIAKQALPGDV